MNFFLTHNLIHKIADQRLRIHYFHFTKAVRSGWADDLRIVEIAECA